MMKNRKWTVRMAAALLASALLLSGCGAKKTQESSASETAGASETRAESPAPEKGTAGSEAYAELFAPLVEKLEWGMTDKEIPKELGLKTDEAIRGDGMLTVPLGLILKVYDRDMTVWMKFDEANKGGLYEITLHFDPELYPEIRDRMIADYGAYQTESDPEKSVFFRSRPLSDYYTRDEIRETYLKITPEEALTEELLDQLMESCEFEFGVRFGGTISMSARNYVAMKVSREKN